MAAKQYYNISRERIGSSRPGDLIKDDLSKEDIKNLLADKKISEQHPIGKTEAAESASELKIAELRGQLTEAKSAAAEKVTELETKITELEGKITELETANAELKELAGGTK